MRGVAMDKRNRNQQPAIWVTTTDLPTAASHPFYRRLNQLLGERRFDDFAEAQCASLYAETTGRPGMPPGIQFRGRRADDAVWNCEGSADALWSCRSRALWHRTPTRVDGQEPESRAGGQFRARKIVRSIPGGRVQHADFARRGVAPVFRSRPPSRPFAQSDSGWSFDLGLGQ